MTRGLKAPVRGGRADFSLLAVLCLAGALLAYSWQGLSGYELADSVEYMERARAIARGEKVIDSQAIRSFGYVGLLVPIFAVADVLGIEDGKVLVGAARLVQIGLCLALVASTLRLARRLFGDIAGAASGLFVATNPVLLHWGVAPLSDVAAALCVLIGLQLVLERDSPRSGLLGGLWIGASLLMAFKTLLLIVAITALLVLRDVLRRRTFLLLFLAGLLVPILVQCSLDQLYYGRFGESLIQYFRENFGPSLAPLVIKLGFRELGVAIYNWTADTSVVDRAYQSGPALARRRMGVDWYLRNLTQMLPWPVLAATALGMLACLARMSWRVFLLLASVLLYASVLSLKGAKEFRLWLPILPLLAAFAGAGIALLVGPKESRLHRLRLCAGVLVCLLGAGLGPRALGELNRRRFGGFWEAMELVNERVEGEKGTSQPRARVSCGYHWAVFLRESEQVELIKLPHQLIYWNRYTDEQRSEDIAAIQDLDWFIAHQPLLTSHPELMKAVNASFRVETFFYEHGVYERLGPIYVLRKRRGEMDERTFFDVHHDLEPKEYQRRAGLQESHHFGRIAGRGFEPALTLLGFEYEALPRASTSHGGSKGDGHGWITYHWYGGPFEADYHLIDRVTTNAPHAWQNNHAPGYGCLPTSSWGEGWIVSEGYPLVAQTDPFDPDQPARPLAGAYLHGDLVPASLWFDVVAYDGGNPPKVVERLVPYRPADGKPIAEIAPPGSFYSPDGHRTSQDSMTLVGRFFLPVRQEGR